MKLILNTNYILMVNENKAQTKYDSYKTSTRVIQQVDMLILSLTQPVFTFKKSDEDWTDVIGENEFLDKKMMLKRSKKYTREWKYQFKQWKTRLNQGVKQAQGGYFNFFAKKELSAEDRDNVVDGIFNEQEVQDLYDKDFVQEEMEADYRSVLRRLAILLGISIDSVRAVVPTKFIQEFRDFAKKIVNSIINNAKSKVQSIIIYGIEQGKTTKEITKEIRTKFDYYEQKESERIVRTETIRASTKGSIAGFDYVGVKHYNLITSVGACPLCIEIAEKGPYAIDDKKGYAPIHPACRCTVIPVIDEITGD